MLLCCWRRPGEATEPLCSALVARGIPVLLFQRRARLRALWSDRPPQMVSVALGRADFARLTAAARSFAPDWLLADGWPTTETALELGSALLKPVVYRSQNAEHQYWQSVATAAKGPSRWRLALTAGRVTRVEARARNGALAVLDIAEEDARACAAAGFAGRSILLPPTWRGRVHEPGQPSRWDVLFGGNLWAPTNVEGLEWFLGDVVPRLRLSVPDLRLCVAGASPAAAVRRACIRSGAEVLSDPDDLASLLRFSRVLVNPVRRSSGVSVKMLEMLAAGPPVVATSAGMRGLPIAVQRMVSVADGGPEFARAIASHLESPREADTVARQLVLESAFGVGRLRQVVEEVRALAEEQS